MKTGAKSDRVIALRRRLAATGELAGQPLDSPDFDGPVAEAVKQFQARHHLPPDGIVAAGTLAELNVPVEARIRQIRINLERGRWALNEITDADFVLVDVAGFEVSYLRKGKPAWKARIQVGKAYSQTPIFKSRIDTVVFNPTWTIPPGIIEKETLPAIRKDPGYLEKKGLELIDAGGRKSIRRVSTGLRRTPRGFRTWSASRRAPTTRSAASRSSSRTRISSTCTTRRARRSSRRRTARSATAACASSGRSSLRRSS
jgi:murein L,D-transpeptidase YcbB/YkuD